MHSRVPDGTLALRQSCHGTARTLSSCTVLCKVASLTGRWLIDGLLTALRGLRPLVPCYARSRSCRDAGSQAVLSRHCEDSVHLYRVMQGRVPDGTNRQFSTLSLNASGKRRLPTGGIRFWKSENTAKFTFAKAKKMLKTVFPNIVF